MSAGGDRALLMSRLSGGGNGEPRAHRRGAAGWMKQHRRVWLQASELTRVWH